MQTLPINLSRPQLVNNVCVRNVKRFRARHNSEWHPRGQTSQDDVHTNTISREDTDDTKPFARFRCFACIPTVASAFLRDIRNCPISYNKVNERIRARHNVVLYLSLGMSEPRDADACCSHIQYSAAAGLASSRRKSRRIEMQIRRGLLRQHSQLLD